MVKLTIKIPITVGTLRMYMVMKDSRMSCLSALMNELKNDRPECEGWPGHPNDSDKNDIALLR
jgi:hypothetical protein